MTRSVWWLVLAGTLGGCVDSSTDVQSNGPRHVRRATDPDAADVAPLAQAAPFSASVPAAHAQDGTLHRPGLRAPITGGSYTPDAFGQYDDGTWSQVADSATTAADGYAPLFSGAGGAARRPADRRGRRVPRACSRRKRGRTEGAIYDPIADKWTSGRAAQPWTTEPSPATGVDGSIGDASGIVLPDGTFMLSELLHARRWRSSIPTALTWTPAGQARPT